MGWRGLDSESDVGCQSDQKESEARRGDVLEKDEPSPCM